MFAGLREQRLLSFPPTSRQRDHDKRDGVLWPSRSPRLGSVVHVSVDAVLVAGGELSVSVFFFLDRFF